MLSLLLIQFGHERTAGLALIFHQDKLDQIGLTTKVSHASYDIDNELKIYLSKSRAVTTIDSIKTIIIIAKSSHNIDHRDYLQLIEDVHSVITEIKHLKPDIISEKDNIKLDVSNFYQTYKEFKGKCYNIKS